MRSKAEVENRIKSLEPKLKIQGDNEEFTFGLSSAGNKKLRPLTKGETGRAKGRAEGWFDALNWVLEEDKS